MPESQKDKFKELVVYIADQCRGDPAFGVVKLNKLLYLADFAAYAKLGKSITGAKYIKLERGPAPSRMLETRRDMEQAQEIWVQRGSHEGRLAQDRIVPRRVADVSVFEEGELAIVDETIAAFREDNATQISDFSHESVGWQIADLQEAIPYETVFLSFDAPMAADQKRAEELMATYGG